MNTLETKKSAPIRRVLVAVDLSDHSEATAFYAAEIAQRFAAFLDIVHVYEPVPLCEYASESTYTLLEEQRDGLQKLLDELTARVKTTGLRCKSVFLVGDAAEQITTLARDVDADLIVVASHHPTFLGRLLNLEKAPKIMHRAPCPVLIYHQKALPTPLRAEAFSLPGRLQATSQPTNRQGGHLC